MNRLTDDERRVAGWIGAHTSPPSREGTWDDVVRRSRRRERRRRRRITTMVVLPVVVAGIATVAALRRDRPVPVSTTLPGTPARVAIGVLSLQGLPGWDVAARWGGDDHTQAIVHASTRPLPGRDDDLGSAARASLGPDDVFMSLLDQGPKTGSGVDTLRTPRIEAVNGNGYSGAVAPGYARTHVTAGDHLVTVEVAFGRARPTAAQVAEANGVLATFAPVSAGRARLTLRASGRVFGYLRWLGRTDGGWFAVFDDRTWLRGEAAVRAARAEGAVAAGDTPGDYFIPRDPDPYGEVVPVSPNATVSRVACRGGCGPNVAGSLTGLAASFGREATLGLQSDYRGAKSRYWVTFRGGRIVAIDEQYVP